MELTCSSAYSTLDLDNLTRSYSQFELIALFPNFRHDSILTGERLRLVNYLGIPDITTTQVNSALHPFGVVKSSTSFGCRIGSKVTDARWQVTPCDPIWRVIFCSGVVISINCYIQSTIFQTFCHNTHASQTTTEDKQTFQCSCHIKSLCSKHVIVITIFYCLYSQIWDTACRQIIAEFGNVAAYSLPLDDCSGFIVVGQTSTSIVAPFIITYVQITDDHNVNKLQVHTASC